MSLIADYLLRLSIVLTMFYDRFSFLLFRDVQVYAAASMNLSFQRKTIEFYSSNYLSYFKSLVRLLSLLFIFIIIFIYQQTIPYLLLIDLLFCSMFSGVAELRSVDRCRFCIH